MGNKPTDPRPDGASEASNANADRCQTNVNTVNITFPAPTSFHYPFKPLPSQIENTYINIPRFAELLRGHPDGYMVEYILHGLKHGFAGDIHRGAQRNRSARDNAVQVTLATNKEVNRGHTAGPFPSPFPWVSHIPVRSSPESRWHRMSRPWSLPTTRRIDKWSHWQIWISVLSVLYIYIYIYIYALQSGYRVGHASWAWMLHVQNQHQTRLPLTRQEDWPLLVYCWEGRYYIDLKLPFGGRSSASISFADLVYVGYLHKSIIW